MAHRRQTGRSMLLPAASQVGTGVRLVPQQRGSCHQQAPAEGSMRAATVTASYVGEGEGASLSAESPPFPSYQPTTHSDFGQESPRALGEGHGEYSGTTQSLQGPLVQEPDPRSPPSSPVAHQPTTGGENKSTISTHSSSSFLNFYCYSITVVCLFSPSLHPTPAEPTSLLHLHTPP